MPDPTRVDEHTGDPERTPEALGAKADRLLARIEDEELIPGWCWGPLSETMARLNALDDDLAWVPVAYLSAVIVRGAAMFKGSSSQQSLSGLAPESTYPTVPCRCGAEVPGDLPQRRGGMYVVCVRCPSCGIELATFNGELYRKPTLIERGWG